MSEAASERVATADANPRPAPVTHEASPARAQPSKRLRTGTRERQHPELYPQKIAVLLIDVVSFLGAFVLAMHLRFGAHLNLFTHGEAPWEPMLIALPVIFGAWLFVLHANGLYRLETLRVFEEVARIFRSLLVSVGLLLTIAFFFRGFSFSRGFAVLFISLLLAMTASGRLAFRLLRRKALGLDGVRERLLLVGDSAVARAMIAASREPESSAMIVGALDDGGAKSIDGVPVLGGNDRLVEVARSSGAHRVVITGSKLDEAAQLALLDSCLDAGIEWSVVPRAYELMLDRVELDVVAGVPVLGLRRANMRGLNRVKKRAFDVVASAVLILLSSPLMLIVSLLIKLSSRGPVLFKQDRVGEGGRHFKFLKFRTMHVNNDDSIHREYAKQWIQEGKAHTEKDGERIFKIEKDPRIFAIGHLLRRYSIDELPQLFNVLRGDMSLIGPRPSIPYEVEAYRPWHRRRFEGPQGITGLWQVSGRNRLSFDEMVKLDIEYIENWSIGLDLKILLRTIGVVLFDRAY
ncbi:MAG: sugar transferase [Deltaproteobacteria bacterium]|nr:sugar transferase [Deltaproteobacteria bacterium]